MRWPAPRLSHSGPSGRELNGLGASTGYQAGQCGYGSQLLRGRRHGPAGPGGRGGAGSPHPPRGSARRADRPFLELATECFWATVDHRKPEPWKYKPQISRDPHKVTSTGSRGHHVQQAPPPRLPSRSGPVAPGGPSAVSYTSSGNFSPRPWGQRRKSRLDQDLGPPPPGEGAPFLSPERPRPPDEREAGGPDPVLLFHCFPPRPRVTADRALLPHQCGSVFLPRSPGSLQGPLQRGRRPWKRLGKGRGCGHTPVIGRDSAPPQRNRPSRGAKLAWMPGHAPGHPPVHGGRPHGREGPKALDQGPELSSALPPSGIGPVGWGGGSSPDCPGCRLPADVHPGKWQ